MNINDQENKFSKYKQKTLAHLMKKEKRPPK